MHLSPQRVISDRDRGIQDIARPARNVSDARKVTCDVAQHQGVWSRNFLAHAGAHPCDEKADFRQSAFAITNAGWAAVALYTLPTTACIARFSTRVNSQVPLMFYTLLTIFLLHWAALVIPGANVLVVSSLAANGSRTAACFAALGITVVAVIWSVFAVLGVNAIFAAHPFLRLSLQLAGGVYLIYMAVRLWRSGGNTDQSADFQMSNFAAFRLGFLTNITNPKSALFFGSIFATALPTDPSTTLLVTAVALIVANAFCWHMFLAFAFSHRPVQDFYVRQRTFISRFSSALVGAFGIRLLVGAFTEVGLQ